MKMYFLIVGLLILWCSAFTQNNKYLIRGQLYAEGCLVNCYPGVDPDTFYMPIIVNNDTVDWDTLVFPGYPGGCKCSPLYLICQKEYALLRDYKVYFGQSINIFDSTRLIEPNDSGIFEIETNNPHCVIAECQEINRTIDFNLLGTDSVFITDTIDINKICTNTPIEPAFTRSINLISVSPNPFTSNTTIRVNPPGEKEGLLRIYDVAGRVVFSKAIKGAGKFNWMPGKAANGIYVLKVKVGDKIYSRKLVLQR